MALLLWVRMAGAGLAAGNFSSSEKEHSAEGTSSASVERIVNQKEEADSISADEVRRRQVANKNFVLFDARSKKKYDLEHIEGAKLPLPEDYYRQDELYKNKMIAVAPDTDAALKDAMRQYPKESMMVAYCNRGCGASKVLMYKLKQLGFENSKFLKDGIDAWQEKGYPVTVGTPHLSSDSIQ